MTFTVYTCTASCVHFVCRRAPLHPMHMHACHCACYALHGQMMDGVWAGLALYHHVHDLFVNKRNHYLILEFAIILYFILVVRIFYSHTVLLLYTASAVAGRLPVGPGQGPRTERLPMSVCDYSQ
jgi:hypothetical protein